MNWGLYIKKLRENAGLTQEELASRSGLKRSHLSRIEAGNFASYKEDTLRKLAIGLGVGISELSQEIYGAPSSGNRETPEEILQRFNVALPSSVPIYEEFPFHAGEPVEPIDYVPVVKDQTHKRNLEGYIVRGKCLSPTIEDKDVIIIDRDAEIQTGDIVACQANGMVYLGRLKRIAGEVYLENNDHRIRLEEAQRPAPVIEVRRRLK